MMGGEGESEHCFIPLECPHKYVSARIWLSHLRRSAGRTLAPG
jgi:hypothetical protein